MLRLEHCWPSAVILILCLSTFGLAQEPSHDSRAELAEQAFRFALKGEFPQALDTIHVAQTNAEQTGDKAGIAISLIDSVVVYYLQGDIPKAMEAFVQIDGSKSHARGGTGLGLPITKRLVELHGGTLTIRSKVEVGTTATVILPKARLVRRSTQTVHLLTTANRQDRERTPRPCAVTRLRTPPCRRKNPRSTRAPWARARCTSLTRSPIT